MNLRYPASAVWLLILPSVYAQDLFHRFRALSLEGDVDGQEALFREWRETDSTDAELAVAEFNHWVLRSRQPVLTLDTRSKDGDMLVITDPDDPEAAPVGFIGEGTFYEPAALARGVAAVDRGIRLHPQRLDLRFGKIHILGESHDWDGYTDEILVAIDHGAATGHAWTWSFHEPVEDGREFFQGNVQAYMYRLFTTGDDELLPHMARIAERVLHHEPDRVASISTLASVRIMQGREREGLAQLKRAETLAPEDGIVVANIAEVYERLGEKKNALKYYRRLEQVGDEDLKAHARQRMAVLGR